LTNKLTAPSFATLFHLSMFPPDCHRFKKAIFLITTKIGDLRWWHIHTHTHQASHGKIWQVRNIGDNFSCVEPKMFTPSTESLICQKSCTLFSSCFPLARNRLNSKNSKTRVARERGREKIHTPDFLWPLVCRDYFFLRFLFMIFCICCVRWTLKTRWSFTTRLPNPFTDWHDPSISRSDVCTCPFELRSKVPSCPFPAFWFSRPGVPRRLVLAKVWHWWKVPLTSTRLVWLSVERMCHTKWWHQKWRKKNVSLACSRG